MFRNHSPPIKLIGIGIESGDLNVTQIETFVGKENYVGTEITEIIKPEFIRNLQICIVHFMCTNGENLLYSRYSRRDKIDLT